MAKGEEDEKTPGSAQRDPLVTGMEKLSARLSLLLLLLLQKTEEK